jgi:hypothetical protein
MIKLPFGQLSKKKRLAIWRTGKCPYCGQLHIVCIDDDMEADPPKTGTVYVCQDCNAMNKYSEILFVNEVKLHADHS